MAMQARKGGKCSLCEGAINPGDAIWPAGQLPVTPAQPHATEDQEASKQGTQDRAAQHQTGTGRGKHSRRHNWVHRLCAAKEADVPVAALAPPVCKHWQQRGVCLMRDKCMFSHPESVAQETKARLAEEQERALTSARPNKHGEVEPTKQNRGKGKRNMVRNKTRGATFRRFLIDTFGHDTLATGSGVLDVAAGKGELSFELTRLNGIPAVAVEPRALILDNFMRRLCKGVYHQNPLFLDYLTYKTPEAAETHQACRIAHVRTLFEMVLRLEDEAEKEAGEITALQALATETQLPPEALLPLCLASEAAWAESLAAARRLTWDRSGLHEKGVQPGRRGKPPRSTAKLERRRRRRRVRREWNTAVERGLSAEEALALVRQKFGDGSGGNHDGATSKATTCANGDTGAGDRAQQGGGGAGAGAGEADDKHGGGGGASDDDVPPAFDIFAEGGSGASDDDECESGCSEARSKVPTGQDDDTGHVAVVAATDKPSQPQPEPAASTSSSPTDTNRSATGKQDGTPARLLSDVVDSPLVRELVDYQEAVDAVLSCSVVVGLHPDQAAEHLVKFALRHRKPFAVVPCCVYTKEFPRRRLKDGRQVRTHQQLVQYLQSLAPGIECLQLPFEGKNRCLVKTCYE